MAQAVEALRLPPKGEAKDLERVNDVIAEYGRKQSGLIPILQQVQEVYHYLPEEILTYVATALGLPPATVYGVATFYAQFSLEPKGKYVVRVCDGTACHVRGSAPVLNAIRKKVGLGDGMKTTGDRQFTVETVSCLGACGLAPAVVINERIYGQMTPDAIGIIIDELLKESRTSDKRGAESLCDDARSAETGASSKEREQA